MIKDNLLMLASGSGVIGTNLLTVVNSNPSAFQSVVGLLTIVFHIFLSYRQSRIEKKQEKQKAQIEVAEIVKKELEQLKKHENHVQQDN